MRPPTRTAKPCKLPRELGLFLIVDANGSKWWRFGYRFGGKELQLSLGTHPGARHAPHLTPFKDVPRFKSS